MRSTASCRATLRDSWGDMRNGSDTCELHAVFVRRAGVCCHELDSEAVLYDPAHHAVHYLNTTAYLIWQHCDGSTDVRALFQRLADTFAYEGPDDHFQDEIIMALRNLIENGLIDRGQLQAA
jgi:PqqD family protein of HPr-rel-A system